jgi:hypothetical protein
MISDFECSISDLIVRTMISGSYLPVGSFKNYMIILNPKLKIRNPT